MLHVLIHPTEQRDLRHVRARPPEQALEQVQQEVAEVAGALLEEETIRYK